MTEKSSLPQLQQSGKVDPLLFVTVISIYLGVNGSRTKDKEATIKLKSSVTTILTLLAYVLSP